MSGYFVISLDFELHWGVFDKRTVKSYQKNLLGVRKVIPKLLKISKKYGIKLTFSTVGFLFAKNYDELVKFNPKIKPTYANKKINPYPVQLGIGKNEEEDPYHYANSLIALINTSGNHEIGTHTFSHYYCEEKGQTIKQFHSDLNAAINIAKQKGIAIKSIVFPRNQYSKKYVKVCVEQNIKAYRGNQKHYIHKSRPNNKEHIFMRTLRFLNSYINLSGTGSYKIPSSLNGGIINLPASMFFRPYNPKLKLFESIRLRRIKKGMQHAALNNEVYHLWWHPHNFGNHMDENFKQIKEIFKEYKRLNIQYDFQSVNMASLAGLINSKNK